MKELRIESWSAADGALLERLLGNAEMTTHLGGPESPAKLAQRQRRYEAEGSRQYRIVAPDRQAVGYVGYWERAWQGQDIWEVGWGVLPEFQGQGFAAMAMQRLLDVIRGDARRPVHAFPSVDNAASNAVCGKLGFDLMGVVDLEYPPGNPIRCNDWRLELGSDS